LLVAEKELSELLQEVFDSYESDTSETLASTDDAGVSKIQLPSSDSVDTETDRSSQDPAPRKLRSTDHSKDDDNDDDDDDDDEAARHSRRQDADSDAFHYPGHIPPLKYVFSSLILYFILSSSNFENSSDS